MFTFIIFSFTLLASSEESKCRPAAVWKRGKFNFILIFFSLRESFLKNSYLASLAENVYIP